MVSVQLFSLSLFSFEQCGSFEKTLPKLNGFCAAKHFFCGWFVSCGRKARLTFRARPWYLLVRDTLRKNIVIKEVMCGFMACKRFAMSTPFRTRIPAILRLIGAENVEKKNLLPMSRPRVVLRNVFIPALLVKWFIRVCANGIAVIRVVNTPSLILAWRNWNDRYFSFKIINGTQHHEHTNLYAWLSSNCSHYLHLTFLKKFSSQNIWK